MKKLNIYGVKKDPNGDNLIKIAEIFVKNKKLFVKSSYPGVEKDLTIKINSFLEKNRGVLINAEYKKSYEMLEKYNKPSEKKSPTSSSSKLMEKLKPFLTARIGDKWFLETLKNQNELWDEDTVGEYKIYNNSIELIDVVGNRGLKVLKLYGKKDNFEGFIAEIYVENNKVVVESEDEEVKKDLLFEINMAIQKTPFLLPYSEETKSTVSHGFSFHKIGDPKFLNALRAEFWKIVGFGTEGKFANKTFGGYKIIAHKSLVVEK
ncbi:MAG: hypothetical protein KKA64_03390 [Nanoarchaeota archaeon]|nr:hypothetical protein [Nanoarchaeota archaeon]